MSKEKIERQDFVDNTIQDAIIALCGKGIPWDQELIATIRDAFEMVIVDELEIMTDEEFYPCVGEDEE